LRSKSGFPIENNTTSYHVSVLLFCCFITFIPTLGDFVLAVQIGLQPNP
jgi:hypothetical protein